MTSLDLDPDDRTEPDLAPAGAPRSVYERIRSDIIEGVLGANERLKVNTLAARYGVSTNPVREALQQLRGEGFVVITPNRGARVRPVDEQFFHDTHEIETLIEPFFTRWFVGVATEADVEQLEAIQAEIERVNFRSLDEHNALDTRFHRHMYERHPNRHMLDIWWNHRDIVSAVARRYDITLSRRVAVIREHRAILACIKAGDADGAAAMVAQHVAGSEKMWTDQMRSAERTRSPRL